MENKIWRKDPIKQFNVDQTMYSLVTNEAKNDLDLDATGFLGKSMTYKELFESSDDLANSFDAMGVKEGDTVSILTPSMPLVEQCLLSLSKIGATMSWIDLRIKEKDLIKYINTTKSRVIVVFEDLLPLIENIIDEVDVDRVIVSSPKDYLPFIKKTLVPLKDKKEGKEKIVLPNDDRFIRFNDFIKEGKRTGSVSAVNFKADRPSLIVQSSGSTGKAKQILHTERNFNSEVQKMAYVDLPFYKGDTMYIAVPPFVIYGLANSFYSSMVFTMKAEITPFMDEKLLYQDLGSFDIALTIPLHYRYLTKRLVELRTEIDQLQKFDDKESKRALKLRLKELNRVLKGIKRVKAFVSGGDKIGAEELIEMQQVLDKPIVNGYGNNECMGATIVSPLFANKPGSIGVPMVGVDIKLVDPITGETVSKGEEGELYISSDNLFVEYLNNKEETDKIKVADPDGKEWVVTGDICKVDDDGYVIPKGRARRLIKKESFKISPDTIEDVIIKLPFVRECVVVGVDDEYYVSVPMAFIEFQDGVQMNDVYAEIEAICAEELPDYEIPSYFEQVDKMPYTPNGKHDFLLLETKGNAIVKQRKGAEKRIKINN